MATATNHRAEPAVTEPQWLENPLQHLSPEQIDAIAEEFDALYDEVKQSLGDRDAAYIRSIIALQRRLALLGRALLFGSRYRPAWLLGTSVLGLAKILENMEIGHNVLHGQWDWMNDPVINSRAWDWDTASTAEAWRHSHMGVALHDMDIEAIFKREKPVAQTWEDLKGISGKAGLQIRKDYIAWPALSSAIAAGLSYAVKASETKARLPGSRPSPGWKLRLLRRAAPGGNSTAALAGALIRGRETYMRTVSADVVANIIRNVWAYAIIFCGHFPDQTYTFSQEETADESPGAKYVRQLIGAANIDGSPAFHVISGNLGYQVEHHLFPDMPSTRYGEIAPKVRDICARYGLPYNTGPLHRQLWMVQRSILRLAFPGGKPRPKPAPHRPL